MILTCPACATKYAIADSALGAEGRKVKCVSCGHKWFQSPETEAAESVSFFAVPTPDSTAGDLNFAASPAATLAATTYSDEDDGFVRRSSARAAMARPEAVAAEPIGSRRSAWGIIALLGLILILALALPRGRIMAIWPNTVHLYRLVRMAPREIAPDLEIRDARSAVRQTPDGRRLTIEGEVVNTGHQVRPVPDLQAIETNNAATIGSWTFPAEVAALAGGKSEHFQASLPAEGDTAGTIALTFVAKAPDGGKNGHR